MGRRCSFCGSQDLSREHILAQWLLKELKITQDIISMSHADFTGAFRFSKRVQPFDKLVNGLVCKRCNNGWMSKLETENMDVITDILNFRNVQKSIEYLFKKNISFSKWAFKNAILFNQATNYRKLVPKEHFTDLYNQKIPNNVFIHIGVSNDDNVISTRQSPVHFIIRDSDLPIDINKKSYRITFKLKHLLVKVVFYESNNKVYYEDEGAIELYPNKYVLNNLQTFSTIDDFDINGAIHEMKK